MLDTQLLCERVRLPHQSPIRALWFTDATLTMARSLSQMLADAGVKKSPSRVVGDGVTVALEATRTDRFRKAVRWAINETSDMPKAKTGVALPQTVWDRLDDFAEELSTDTKVTPSEVLRALAHMATTQVHDEFTDR